jgi:hypothetical protein
MSTIEGWSHDSSYEVKELKVKIEVLERRVDQIVECLRKWQGPGFTARNNLVVSEDKHKSEPRNKKLQKHNRRIILNSTESLE